jgi:hypothetical protein
MVASALHQRWLAVACGLSSLLILQTLVASRAAATCGDWLAHPGERGMSADGVKAAEQPAAQSALNNGLGSSRLPISKPCNGPYCRSAPYQSAPATPVTILLPSDRLAVFGSGEQPLSNNSQYLRAGEFVTYPLPGFKARIEHPPRT